MEGGTAYFQGIVNSRNGVWQNCRIETFNYSPPEETSEKVEKCIAALGQSEQDDVRDTFHLYHKEVTPESCRWILNDNTFKRWTSEGNSDHPLIWVGVGERGGKTTHAVWISEHLERHASAEETWVLYHFCDSQRPEGDGNAAASVLKSFMRQLCRKHPPLGSILYQEYRKTGDELLKSHLIAHLWRLFISMVETSPVKRIFCIVDGADQCYEDKYLGHFLKRFSAYFTDRHPSEPTLDLGSSPSTTADGSTEMEGPSPKSPELRAIILSRESPSCIVEELGHFPRLDLRNHGPPEEDSDLKRFVHTKIADVSASVSSNKANNSESIELVTRALEGWENQSFVWVDLIAEKLMGLKQSQLKKSLPQIPSSPEEIYARALLAVPARQKPHVAAVLKWVALAARPLSPLELTKAVKYSLKTTFTKRNLKKTLSLCHDLVQKTELPERGKEIKLKDYCVQQLCFEERSILRQIKGLEVFVFDRSDAHSELTNTCIAYLQETANFAKSRRVRLKPGDKLKGENATFFRKHPFLEYTIVHWTFHARRGNLEKTDYDCAFFKEKSSKRRTWWESYWISLRRNFAWKWTAPGNFSLLHLAAFFDIVPLAEFVKSRGRIEDLLYSEDNQGMKPLNWATERSQTSMVEFLLECGDFDEAALRQAAKTGELSIIEMLLVNRERRLRTPPPLSRQSSPRTPSSPFQSFDAARKITLSSIADLSKKYDTPRSEDSSPLSPGVKGYGKATSESVLHIAATYGHEEAVKLFIDNGEDVRTATDGGWTALHNAAWFGRGPVIDRLIDAGADADGQTNESLTPLHCAVKNAQREAVTCLLDKRIVNVDAEDQHGLTPFHMASKAGEIDLMEVLLLHGANVDYKMRQGWTPLMWACIHGQRSVVQFLLDHGGDATAKWTYSPNGTGETVEVGLVALAKTYHQEQIALLVERHGAVNAEPLDRDAAEAILPAANTVEVYNLPVVEDTIVADPEDAESDDVLDLEDDEGDSESEGDSDAESQIQKNQTQADKDLSGDGDDDVHSRDSTSHAILGLGIREDNEGVASIQLETIGGATPSVMNGELGAVIIEVSTADDSTPGTEQLLERVVVPISQTLPNGMNEDTSTSTAQEERVATDTTIGIHMSDPTIPRLDEQDQKSELSVDSVRQNSKGSLDLLDDLNVPSTNISAPQDQKSKINLFNAKRLFTWKRGSEDKSTPAAPSESLVELLSASSSEPENVATTPRVVSTPSEPGTIELDDAVGGAESVPESEIEVAEPGSQNGRSSSFFGKTLFGKKKSVDNQ